MTMQKKLLIYEITSEAGLFYYAWLRVLSI